MDKGRKKAGKNFSLYHIISMLTGFLLSFVYWQKVGQFSDYVLKNNLILVSVWGVLVGYFICDLVLSAINKK